MKDAGRVTFASFAILFLAVGVLALPRTTHNGAAYLSVQAAPQTQSVSGKITAVAKDSFTLALAGGAESSDPKTMTFFTDQNTTVDGTLKVGANADVTYREENGKNLAISVKVTS